MLTWVMQVAPKCNHTCPDKKEIEGHLIIGRRAEGNVTTEAERRATRLQTKASQQPPDAGRGKAQIPPESLGRGRKTLPIPWFGPQEGDSGLLTL